jgi:tRNA nucleotidyltransferase (CCA-adding enzyme)
MPQLSPPRTVLEIARKLEDAGFEAWCVGGAVRDALLGEPHLDWDLATSATPQQVREIFGSKRIVPVGIEFGTIGVLDRERRLHEVTTFRRDIRTDGRHAEVEFGASLEEDLARRDFTMNAIAYSPFRDEIRDPFSGRDDLARHLVRAVGDPEARMREDRLRALRAIRFAARFGFSIDPPTLAAIESSSPHLGRLSAERVKQELEKTMEQVARPSVALKLWRQTGALGTLVPALGTLNDETLLALDFLAKPGSERRPYRRLLRIALLFVTLGPAAARSSLAALRFSRQEIARITSLAAAWSAIGEAMTRAAMAEVPSDAQLRRWVAVISRLDVGLFLRLASALWEAHRVVGQDAPSRRATRALYRRMQRVSLRDPIEIRDLAVDGDDLQKAGIRPGPRIGKILQLLLDAVLEDPARNTRDSLLREAKRLGAELPD